MIQLVLSTAGPPLEKENMVSSKQTIQNCAGKQKAKAQGLKDQYVLYINMSVVFLNFFFILYFTGYILLYLSPNVNRGDCVSFLLIAFDMKLATLHLRLCV